MNRKFILVICALLFLIPRNVVAIPAEGTVFPEKDQWIGGLQLNNIQRRDFNKVPGGGSTVQYFVRASYGLTECFSLDGKLGLGDIIFDRENASRLEYQTGFAGGYGFRYLISDDPDGFTSVFGFQHISIHPMDVLLNGSKYEAVWDEWQGTLLFGHVLGASRVYAGPQYTTTQLKYKVDGNKQRLKVEDFWGAVLGADIELPQDFYLNLEVRFPAEQGFNIGINRRF